MAEETPVSPISEAVPPKANPLAAPATAHAATLKLKPVIRPAAGLKPGLKLPPKPGVTSTGLKPGLKLPPKPGMTATGLKPGIKLPARPVIRKPGEAPKPVSPVVAAPVAATAPAAPAAAPTPKPMEALKTVTQNLKSMTAAIPQQAVLHKTGIIATSNTEMTEAQKQAAKSKTARISLSDAMGVAPVKNEALPMKTIRIKRPVDLPAKDGAAASAVATSAPDTQAKTPSDETAEGATTSFTQRKTLKITRPTSATVRPTGKFAIKKPGAPAPSSAAAPAAEGAPEVADIPEMPAVSMAPVPMNAGDTVPDVPKGVAIAGLIVQIAACLTIAFLGWLLFQNTQLPLYCGGCL